MKKSILFLLKKHAKILSLKFGTHWGFKCILKDDLISNSLEK